MTRKIATITRNIVTGMGVVLDITGARPRTVHDIKSDASALRSDWEKVGSDMRYAMRTFKKQNKDKLVAR